MPIAQVAEGIMAKFSGSALSTTVGGRIWRDSAKQNETMPYIVFTSITSDDYPMVSGERIEYHHVIFYIYTDDINPATASTGLDALESALYDLFNGQILTISGWTATAFLYKGSRPANSEDDNVIGVIMEFETYIQKT